jgi:ATP-dependent protease ClpP protease subunit
VAKKKKLKIPPVLFAETQKIVRSIAKETGGTFLSYWNSTSGSVCQNDVLGFYEVLQRIGPQDSLHLFIKSDGGDGTASLRIVNLLRRYSRRLVTVLPLECASAATMIALGSDEIHMGPLAFLTAVDTSLTHDLSPIDVHNRRVSVSQDELNRVVKLWHEETGQKNGGERDEPNPYSALFQFVHPLVIGAVDRSSSLSVKLCTEILGYHMKDRGRAERISVELNSAYPAHDYPIVKHEAARLGLDVRDLDPKLHQMLLDLHALYSEMGQLAVTDYDERNYHNNEILNIIESVGIQVYYQNDKDWHYRTEEKRWVPMNDGSSWRKIEKVGAKTVRSVFHIR